ncbi:MAG: hypothetical protein Q9188_005639 [Gyalolechia gomerana]
MLAANAGKSVGPPATFRHSLGCFGYVPKSEGVGKFSFCGAGKWLSLLAWQEGKSAEESKCNGRRTEKTGQLTEMQKLVRVSINRSKGIDRPKPIMKNRGRKPSATRDVPPAKLDERGVGEGVEKRGVAAEDFDEFFRTFDLNGAGEIFNLGPSGSRYKLSEGLIDNLDY